MPTESDKLKSIVEGLESHLQNPDGALKSHLDELEALNKALRIRENAMEACTEGIAILDVKDPGFPLIYVNAGFERQTGYSREEVLYQSARFIHGPDTDEMEVAALRKALKEGREYTTEVLSYRKGGAPFWNRISLTPLRNEKGEVTHCVAVQSDVSSRMQSNAEVQEALELLERTNMQLTRANKRMKANLRAAATVQRALLPEKPPNVGHIRFAWTYRPCEELAGDTFNIFRLNKTNVGIYLLDVSGHGTAAALLAVSVNHLLSPKALSSSMVREHDDAASEYRIVPPAEVAGALNKYFKWDPDTAQFFTMIYGVLDTAANRFRFISAGHPGPVHVHVEGTATVVKGKDLPIGLSPGPYSEHVIDLLPGERVYLYSDGIPEAMNTQRELYTRKRMRKRLAALRSVPLEESHEQLIAEVTAWNGSSRFDDDLSLLSFEMLPES
ncbi:MAG: SpoIIE family protein phosphatase [Candidatus Hydrogenedentes bacterium]|nr:SpoIIE family protein phosphatase [Candidatus Hydrogenedentota bacterium]